MWYNGLMKWVLRSPLHGMLSKSTMVITFAGRKTGRTFSTPVNYVRDGKTLWLTSYRTRTWWRNLLGGAAVRVLVAGKELEGRGEAFVEAKDVAEKLAAFLRLAPAYARYFGVALTADRQPLPEDVARAAGDRVMIRINLT